MEFLQPATWSEALAMKSAHPEAMPIAGGTDVMVEINLDRHRPLAVIDLTRVGDITWGFDSGMIRVGAGVTYSRIIEELPFLPGLAMASRTVGSPQIRNRGTVGGNLGTASPAGDALPPLLACGALVELASTSGTRRMPIDKFFAGPKKNVTRKDELIAAFLVPTAKGGQQFCKVGTRNAMVIAVCSFAIDIDPIRRRIGTGIGSAGPTPMPAIEAEHFIEGVFGEEKMWDTPADVGESELARFGELVASAARPIDDIRGTAAYRRHALTVLARRALVWAWNDTRTREIA
jgi:CO/xanthine dehydrogenase FAD-binding subunit